MATPATQLHCRQGESFFYIFLRQRKCHCYPTEVGRYAKVHHYIMVHLNSWPRQELQQVHRELHAERQLRRRLQEEVEQLKVRSTVHSGSYDLAKNNVVCPRLKLRFQWRKR